MHPGSLAALQGMGLGQAPGLQQPQLGAQQQQGSGSLMASGSDGSAGSTSAGSLTRGDVISEQAASAQQLWQALAQADAGQLEPQVLHSQPVQVPAVHCSGLARMQEATQPAAHPPWTIQLDALVHHTGIYTSKLQCKRRTAHFYAVLAKLSLKQNLGRLLKAGLWTAVQEAANAAELKRVIENLPLETSAVAAVEWRLGPLEPAQFAALLTELARDNHAFRCAAACVSTLCPYF